MDVITHNRSIYTLWDFFGDVGGLFDMLKLISQTLLSFVYSIIGSGLDKFLLERLFTLDKKRNRYANNQNESIQKKKETIIRQKNRKPFSMRFKLC